MPTQTAKIEIYPADKGAWDRIREIHYKVYRAANEIISTQFFCDQVVSRIKESVPGIDKDAIKEAFTLSMSGAADSKGYSQQNISYKLLAEKYPDIPACVRSALNAQVVSVYRKDKKEVMRGDRAIRSYRRGKIGIPSVSSSFDMRPDGMTWKLSKDEKIDLVFRFGRDKSNNRSIVEKILSGKYKFSDSQIKIIDGKMFFLLCYTFDPEPIALDPDICVGVDVGVTVPAYAAVNSKLARTAIGSRDAIMTPRLRMQAQRKALQRALRHGATSGGKGRKKKLKGLDSLEKRERNFVKNANHNISRRIVDFALKQNAGVIKLEQLTGFGEDQHGSFILRNWSYFELQSMIEYKAKAKNIEVRYVDPAYTSQTCHVCGHQEKEQRMSQSEFVCHNSECSAHGEVINADYNAAKNIANSENYLTKEQAKAKRKKKAKEKKEKTRAVRRPKGEAKGTPQAVTQLLMFQ